MASHSGFGLQQLIRLMCYCVWRHGACLFHHDNFVRNSNDVFDDICAVYLVALLLGSDIHISVSKITDNH